MFYDNIWSVRLLSHSICYLTKLVFFSLASTSHQHTISALYKFLAEVGGAKAFALIQPSVNKHDYYEHLDALTMATCQTLYPYLFNSFSRCKFSEKILEVYTDFAMYRL